MKLKTFFTLLFFLVSSFYIFCQDENNPNGFNKFYYPNGNVSSEGMMKKGKPEGYWKTYYINGMLKSEGNRKNFLLDSSWKFYDETGILLIEIEYSEDKKNGFRLTYTKEGFLISKENFSNDQKENFSYYYYPTKELQKKINFVEGKENGEGFEYSKEGEIITLLKYQKGYMKQREEINRKDKKGWKQGKWKVFYENGNVKLEGNYKDDKKDGYFKEYSNKGVLLNTVKYSNGEVEENVEELINLDIEKTYYPNAKVKTVSTYRKGEKEGIMREYDINGVIINAKIFTKGELQGEGVIDEKGIKQGKWKEYHTKGKLRAEGSYKNGKRIGEWIFYHPNGKIEQKGKYVENEKPDGLWIWYYSNGKIIREENYRDGYEEGKAVEYDKKGKIIAEGEYLDGQKEGLWIYEEGDDREEGNYQNGSKHGIWRQYYMFNDSTNTENQLSFEGNYIDGEPDGKHTYYYANGKKKLEGKYIMGQKEGEWKRYNENGTLLLTIWYKDGIEKKIDGNIIKPEVKEQ